MLRTTPKAARSAPAPSITPISRPRRVLLAMPVLLLAASKPAEAKSFKEAQAEKEERRRKLREAAETQKETGEAVDAFEQPEYSISEEARLPNFRMRTTEGTREEKRATR